jgi:hypothetical protein
VSNRSTIVRTKLELELKHLKEKQRVDQEQRDLHLEMQKHEMEQQKRLTELEERGRLHELEVRLAEAQMQKQLEHDEGDPDSRSNRGDDYPERLDHLEEQVDHPIAASGMNNNIETSTRDATDFPRVTLVNQIRLETHNSPSTQLPETTRNGEIPPQLS